MSISVLDMSSLESGSDDLHNQFCQDILSCLSAQGFVKLVNHGIPDKVIHEAFEWNKRFFALPENTKRQIAHPPQANPNRGWSAIGQEKSSAITDFEKGKAAAEEVFDVKEAFDIGAMDDDLYDNIWLKEKLLPGFQTFVESFYDSCHRLHITILRALESGFRERGMDVGLVSRCLPNVSELRLNYYPSVDIKEMRTGKINRISAHTDFGTVTLLFQDSVGGLEVEDQDNLGTYFPVEASSKTEILVNIGDSLQRLTNDFLTSVSHRVRVPIGLQEKESGIVDERYSIAYFAKVARVQSLQPLPQFVNEVNPPKYPNVTAYELNQTKLERIYGKDVGDNLGGRMLKAIFGWIPRIW